MHQPRLTRHAQQRLQQRGSRPQDVAIVMAYGDIEVPARNGCRYIQLSQKEMARLQREDIVSVSDMDRARRLVVLVDTSDRIVTILKGGLERKALFAKRAAMRR
jgi:hypothetical protein